MKIEEGKYYKTRVGKKARIYATDGGFGKRIHGAVLQPGGRWILTWWPHSGNYSFLHDTDNDLIAEWTEPLDFDKSCLPAWAEWIAMDRDGDWWWYIIKPTYDDYTWQVDSCDLDDICMIPAEYSPKNYTGDWWDSLRKVSDL